MAKIFDKANRKKLFEELNDKLEEDEYHIPSMLTNQPEIKVKIGGAIGESFKTRRGIM